MSGPPPIPAHVQPSVAGEDTDSAPAAAPPPIPARVPPSAAGEGTDSAPAATPPPIPARVPPPAAADAASAAPAATPPHDESATDRIRALGLRSAAALASWGQAAQRTLHEIAESEQVAHMREAAAAAGHRIGEGVHRLAESEQVAHVREAVAAAGHRIGEGVHRAAESEQVAQVRAQVAAAKARAAAWVSEANGGGAGAGADWEASLSEAASADISAPADFQQQISVTYNAELARFEGLPPEWSEVNRQFGVPLRDVPKAVVPGYPCRIPAVLELLRRALVEQRRGLEVEGIFRLAPDADDCAAVKRLIDAGEFDPAEREDDPNIYANLIKVFFREMPEKVLDVVPEQDVYRLVEAPLRELPAEMERLAEPQRSLLLWLLDLMAAVTKREEVNRMSAKNVAIVFAPNLFSVSSDNPMAALTLSQKIVDLAQVMLRARLADRHGGSW